MDLKTAFKNTTIVYPRLPRAEFECIREHKDEAIPRLLRRLKRASTLDYEGSIEYAMFPLAEFRERKAVPYLLEILRLDEAELDYLLGDILTDGCSSVLASCAAREDIPLIKEVILDDTLFDFARHTALHSLNIMFAEGDIERDFLINLYSEILEKTDEDDFFYELALSDCSDLHLDEFSDTAKQYYKTHVSSIRETFDTWQKALNETTRENAAEKMREDPWGRYVRDMIEDISRWRVFSDGSDYDFGEKIGRNDLCPCGSEIKFKKCCGRWL
ncbi:MAG: DUF1186 domain-containing protein [Oscillospiraceae bacterium]|jgi:hypothetical protein|nr:DUF1186 domain-containing protein [Oscillospiraceae bacterium]